MFGWFRKRKTVSELPVECREKAIEYQQVAGLLCMDIDVLVACCEREGMTKDDMLWQIRDLRDKKDEPSGASGGSATLTVVDVGLLYDEWKRLHCGPRRMVSLIRKPYWKKVLSVPWLWWTHFGTACQHATVFQSASLATLFVYAFLKTCK